MAFLLDDDWDNDPRVIKAGTAAFGLYSRCGMWVARHLTDGHVPADVAASYGTREWVAKLVDAGLWKTVVDGYQMVDYLALNPDAVKVRKRREQYAERQRRYRSKQETRKSRSSHASGNASPSPLSKERRGASASQDDRPPQITSHCGECDQSRWLLDEDGRPISKCPRCHPANVRPA